MREQLRNALRLFLATLHEIFDEASYARFLTQQGMTPSRESYALFERVTRRKTETKPRCC